MDRKAVPIWEIMDLAKIELSNHIATIMQNNNIPAGLMNYIVNSISADLQAMALAESANAKAATQNNPTGTEVNNDG